MRRRLAILWLAGTLAATQAQAQSAFAELAVRPSPAQQQELFPHTDVAGSQAEPEAPFPRFRLEVQADGRDGLFVLGLNSFTARQLLQFLAGLGEFLDSAHALTGNSTLVLRQAGDQGYLALAATRKGQELEFTLTLHAEAPAAVAGDSGVHSLGLRIADQLLPVP